ncbi:hypothetical protein DX873_07290 [Flagellimonas nanhaiensis]|uniref:Uncharacterized protein n=2 Tax=Flagellimonas nanhaiensis TaxID=2292706 RepID=A0A371JVW0_9FLAO|nr:hypothetical protein DX873_07290 [Allomuricauda nanhaiensis]
MDHIKFSFKLFLVFFTLCQLIQAQERQEFSGPMKIGPYIGKAEYTFILKDNDTILDGAFRMNQSNLDALLKNSDGFFSFTGSFDNGYPDGDWKFQFGEFQSESETEVVGYQYRVKVSGTQHEATGNMVLGKPDGNWTYMVTEIENSEVNKTLFSSTVEFDQGVPQKSFRIENEHNSLVGRFLRNGLAHDIWTLYSDEFSDRSENWFFNEGALQKIEYNLADGEVITKKVASSSNLTKVIDLDERFINLLKINQKEPDTTVVFQKGIGELLTENSGYYRGLDTILSALGKSEFMPGFKVKAAHFPLDSLGNEQLQSIKTQYARVRKTSQSLLENTQLNILRRSDREAQFLYAVISKISEDFLNPAEKLVDYHNQGILEFIPTERLFDNVWSKGIPSKTILVQGEEGEQTYVGPGANEFELSENTITSVHQLIQYAALSIESIAGKLEEKLLKESKQQELVALEEKMIAQSNHIGQVLDSVKLGLSKREREALESIQNLADALLEKYATMDGTGNKTDFGLQVIDCLEQLDGLTIAVAELPNRWANIQEKYQDDVWNPFMATVMSEEVKKRISNSYRSVLVPYLLEEIKSSLSCDNVTKLKALLNSSYQRMLEMREENTSKLERKLRKEQDPEMIIQLFNLKSSENE